jgi:hypothetical protein
MMCADGFGDVCVELAVAFAAVVFVVGAIEVVDLGCDQASLAAERVEVQSLRLDSAPSRVIGTRLANIECEHHPTTSCRDSGADTAGRSERICQAHSQAP